MAQSKQFNPQKDLIKREHQILSFWRKNKIFEKLVKKNRGKKNWSFLDGPITANNPMGVHHAWGRTYKDLFQRHKAMQGYDQRFQNGFDCQGLWVEVEVEKELDFKTKKDIEDFGIENFVKKCKERVLKYSKIQTDQSKRLGQWMDWDNSYYTMSDENNFAIWHFLKKCHQKGLIYKGRDVVPWCLRCGTAISQHEILSEEYKNLSHKSVYLKLPIKNRQKEFLLVWTTTPWTLPANVSVAVNPDLEYLKVEQNGEKYYLLEKLKEFLEGDYKEIEKIKGKDLVGLKYEGPFDNLPATKGVSHKVVAWDEVAEDEGTGLVHVAPGCGQEDFSLSKKEDLDVIDPIDNIGNYKKDFGFLAGKNVKDIAEEILSDLEKRNIVYKIHDYVHRYPTCWRCKEELIFRLVDEWYIAMDKLREPMMEIAKKIKWLPSFGLSRELDWLKNMQDWLISKKRYWGLALPIYECSCGNFEVIGSKEELKEKSVSGWEEFSGHTPHRPWVDKIKIRCSKCEKNISRIPDVGNPWLDAGIVPFSTIKYFEDKSFWGKWFPPEFICESFPGQFKNWFYSLIAASTVLENSEPFKKVLGYASVRDEKGEEMHKSKGNAIWFDEAAEKMGVDIMRWLYVSADPFKNLLFGYHVADKVLKRFILIYKNVFNFFLTYSKIDQWKPKEVESKEILDRWIISRLNQTTEEVTINLDKHFPHKASRAIERFVVEDLSTWYLRRSRKRRDDQFYSTMDQVLSTLVKLTAPFIPFISEDLYQKIKTKDDPESVHLCDWPRVDKRKINKELNGQMEFVRTVIELGHAIRAEEGIRLRQPLEEAYASRKDFLDVSLEWAWPIIERELNVKRFRWVTGKKVTREELKCKEDKGTLVCLDTYISDDLRLEGVARDIIRGIQETRREAGLSPDDEITIYYQASGDITKAINRFSADIERGTNSSELINQKGEIDYSKDLKIGKDKIWIGIKK